MRRIEHCIFADHSFDCLQVADAALNDDRAIDAEASHSYSGRYDESHFACPAHACDGATCDLLRLLKRRGRRRWHVAGDDHRLQRQRHSPDVTLYSELDCGGGRAGDDALAQLKRLL
jgi:hypothetical protein